jgi:hypothetical protein
VGFEPTIAVLERAKTVRALDRSATAIGSTFYEGNLDAERYINEILNPYYVNFATAEEISSDSTHSYGNNPSIMLCVWGI